MNNFIAIIVAIIRGPISLKKKQFLKKVKSVCPTCLDIIDADVIIKNGKVVLSKKCPKHGKFEFLHIWDDPWSYKKIEKIFRDESTGPNGILIDLTLRCNLNCPFCFSLENNKKSLGSFREPSIDDILEKVKRFKKVVKFSTIFLFGGEPTLRKDLFEIIKNVKKLGLDVCLFTNGLKLADKTYVHKLKKYGVDYVVFQFDTLDKDINKTLRGKDILKDKLQAISNLKKEKIVVDFFTVIIKNINEDDVKKIILFASKHSEIVKNIYLSTITYEGKGKRNSKFKQVTNSQRLELIEKELNITKKDFLECTVFDYYFYKFTKRLTGVHSKHLAACDMMCYLYSLKDNEVIPLNRLVNLRNLTGFFDESIEILNQDGYLRYLKVFGNFIRTILTKEIIIKWSIVPELFKSTILSLKPLLQRKPPKNNFSNVFRIIVTQFQDKYNLDFDTFRNCNLWSELPNGEISTFCQKNILYRYGTKQ